MTWQSICWSSTCLVLIPPTILALSQVELVAVKSCKIADWSDRRLGSKLRFQKSGCSTARLNWDSGNQPWSSTSTASGASSGLRQKTLVMELNKETEIYLQTTMLCLRDEIKWTAGERGGALTFTNIVITGQFPILNLSTSWFKNKPCQHCLKLPNINLQIFCVYLSTNISWKLNKQIIAISTFKQFYFRNIRQRNQSQNFSTWSCYPCAEKSQFYRNVLVNFVLVHWCWGAQIPPSKNLPILVTWASIGALFCTRFQQISLSQSSSRSQRIRGKDFLQQWKRESDKVNFCNWCPCPCWCWMELLIYPTLHLSLPLWHYVRVALVTAR